MQIQHTELYCAKTCEDFLFQPSLWKQSTTPMKYYLLTITFQTLYVGPIPHLSLWHLSTFEISLTCLMHFLWPESTTTETHAELLSFRVDQRNEAIRLYAFVSREPVLHVLFSTQVSILLVPHLSTQMTRAPCPEVMPSLWMSCIQTPGAPQTAASASRGQWATLTFTPTEALSSPAATSRILWWGLHWKGLRASRVCVTDISCLLIFTARLHDIKNVCLFFIIHFNFPVLLALWIDYLNSYLSVSVSASI